MKHDNENPDALLVTLSVGQLRQIVRDEVARALRPVEPAAMLKPREAAALLRCTERHVRNLLASGALAGVRIGSSWRIRRDAVEALVGARGAA
ncbi:MAG: helix-turn-helix domain-containing protein [Myxococcota bacterium]|nr:helix-turn-helix domain-containing protein [Myxococcota bacterium]